MYIHEKKYEYHISTRNFSIFEKIKQQNIIALKIAMKKNSQKKE